jgi:membrane protein DedA with SNARE-associated domain
MIGGVAWGVGYSLLGYAAGSAYAVVEKRVGAGLAVAAAVIVIAGVAVWAVRRHRGTARAAGPAAEAADPPDAAS